MDTTNTQAASTTKPQELRLGIDTGMLESLGLNMYTSVGKSLVEFVANGYDADAELVEIHIPFDRIEETRAAVREQAKKEVEEKKRDKFTVLQDPLPENIEIVIQDNGHGMSAEEVQSKYLVVNRNRRKSDGGKSESGLRHVMGRKGLGKLAGFGTAEKITIRTKRKNETYATQFIMDYEEIRKKSTASDVTFTPEYIEGLSPDEHGTKVVLSRLRCDAIKAKEPTMRNTLAQNFVILGEAFVVKLNGEKIVEESAEYEFKYPSDDKCDQDGYATIEVNVADVVKFPIRYRAMFRARKGEEQDKAANSDGQGQSADVKGSLPARLRGARIYCNKRLAAGPSLFELPTGMHNFHSQSYMECVVHADELDRQDVDHISTSRTDLKSDTEVVDALIRTVTQIMKDSLQEHGKFRDKKAEQEMDEDPVSKALLDQVDSLSKDTRVPARKALKALAARHGTQSRLFREIAPLVVRSMNTGEVLVKLAQLGDDPKSISVVGHELVELARIEHSDALKLYRGRRNGIQALQKLQQRSMDEWKSAQFEGELHQLLKESPWLIEPEFSRYLASDKSMGDVARQLDKELGIDSEKPKDYDPKRDKDNTRPDLVFVLVDGSQKTNVTVVELKSPNVPLTARHLTQLEGYMTKVERYLKNEFKTATVHGYLIGSLPDETTRNSDEMVLLSKYQKSTPAQAWQIIPLTNMLERAKTRHMDYMEVLAKEEERLNEELN